jgi:broad specificity phosphatase PhoE
MHMIYPSQRIFLVRHGETEWSCADKHTGKTDISLTQTGRQQAERLQKRLTGHTFERVFCSPLKRAKETCELAGFSKQMELIDDLQEWDYGKYEGLTTQEIHKNYDPKWNIFISGAPEGESIPEVSERASHVLALIKECKGDVLIFSHGHFSRLLGARWIGLGPNEGRLFTFSAAGVSILGFEKNYHAFLCWNDTSHLEKH